MGVKLNKETSDVIHVSKMKSGQIGEIVCENIHLNGLIVKRMCSHLFSLSCETYWIKTFDRNNENKVDFNIVILKNGETLTITDNE